jgi:two-component system cell cycle sensor histidine kinase/response regulator CckA
MGMKPAPKIPYGGKATAIFGLVLIAIFWVVTAQRSATELSEAISSEYSKNANLALALDVQTNQLLTGIDNYLLLIKDQYERPDAAPVPLRRLVTPAFGDESSITFIGVINDRGDLVESMYDFAPTNAADREFFQTHRQSDTHRLLISEPVLGRVSGRWAITLTRRLNKPDGSFGGIAVISIEPRYLTRLFETTTLGPLDVMSLVLTNGISLARRRGETISFGEDIAQSQLMVEQRQHPVGNYTGPGGLDGNTRFFSYRTMRDYPVIVTVGTLERDALAAVRARSRAYQGAAILLTFLVGAGCTLGILLLARNERANQRLLEQASLLDKAQDAILVTNLQRRLTFWNKSAERLYGWTAREAIGQVLTDLLYPDGDTRDVSHAFDDVLSNGEWTGELQLHTKTGRRVIIESRWTLVRDATGEPASILSINTDVTDRRQLEQQFYRAQRLESIGTLAGGIAHDLNNVLSPIILGMGILRERLTDADSREVMDTMTTSAKRGAEMVAQVLSFARGQEGRRVEIKPADLIADVVRIARDTFPKTIEIATELEPQLPLILGDPTQCHQVLLNLCVNARDAMPGGGRLTLSAMARGGSVIFRVEDTGPGIPASVIGKIFDPFFTTKEAGKGTGLGLSTSQTIVRSHGGKIEVLSEPPHGARFEIHLPVAPMSAQQASGSEPVQTHKGNGETILVVDDEPSVRLVMRTALERAGYQVLPATNGKEAIEVFKSQPRGSISAVIIDMMMPVMGGLPAMQEMVKINPDIRIIAASGIPDNEATAKAVGRQVRQFLPKPFSTEKLLRAVGRAVAAS